MVRKLNLKESFESLKECFKHYGRPPSYEEVAKWFGYKSKNAAYWLVNKLKDHGVVSSDDQGRLTIEGLHSLKLLGSVQAGFPSPAEEELTDVMDLNQYLVERPNSTYLVRVQGDSMVDAGIKEGDLVVVDRGREPKINDIVVAEVDGEWTMKYYTKKGEKVVLVPANENYEPIYPKFELKIGGVVTGVIRKYR